MGRLVVVVRSAVASVVTARLVVERVGRAGTARVVGTRAEVMAVAVSE